MSSAINDEDQVLKSSGRKSLCRIPLAFLLHTRGILSSTENALLLQGS